MRKAQTAPSAAEKVGDGKPYVRVQDERSKKLKHVRMDEVKVELEDPRPKPWRCGPQIGEDQIKDSEYLALYASPEELAVFRAAVAGRRAKSAEGGWRDLPNGTRIRADHVLATCFNCGIFAWVKASHTTSYCPSCNMMQRVGGGKLRPVSPEEEKAWFERETAREARWKADAPKREAEQRQLADLRLKLGL